VIYPYLCIKCDLEFEVIKSVRHIDEPEQCENCGNIAERTIAFDQSFSKMAAGDWNTPHYNPAFGRHMKSNKEAQKEAKRLGLEEVGNEPIEKIENKFSSEREEKSKRGWDSINMNLGEIKS